VDANASAHAVWLDHRDQPPVGKETGHGTHQHAAQHDGVAMAQKSALYYAPADGSRPEHKLAAGVCYCCKTALAAGKNGLLFAAWRHVYPGNLRDMALALSRDHGASFSDPARVSEDGWAINACPDDGPAIVADAEDNVHIVWPTVLPGSRPEGAVFYASTVDGRTFTPRLRVPTLGGTHPRHVQIVLDGRGRVFVAWDESVKGKRVAAAREVIRTGNQPASFGETITIDSDGPAVYPVMAATASGIVAAWTSGAASTVVRVRTLPTR
jgi:hypothetical protein